MTVVTDNTHVDGAGQKQPVEDRDIPIGIIGKNQEYGKAAFDALSPKYKVVLVASEVDDFVSKLKSAETTPRAVSIGPIYPAEEQDRLAKGIESSGILCKVIRTQPLEKYMKEMDEKTKGMEELEKVGKITRMMFDAANIE